MGYLWHTIFYDPLLNGLIYLYNGPAGQNLGIALIELTVLVRICLLPLSILSIRARSKYDKLQAKVREIDIAHKDDQVKHNEEIRSLLKANRINPWAKATALGIQFMILIVLYKVFVDAVRGHNLSGLYAWNYPPDFLNSNFLGIDLVVRNIYLSGLIGFFLYLDLWLSQRKHKETLTNGDVFYRVAFPVFSFLILYMLPAGKSVFVLTSIFFSLIIELIRKMFVRGNPKPNN